MTFTETCNYDPAVLDDAVFLSFAEDLLLLCWFLMQHSSANAQWFRFKCLFFSWNWEKKFHCINPRRKFIMFPQEKRQGPQFKVSSERLSPEIDIWSHIPKLTEPDNKNSTVLIPDINSLCCLKRSAKGLNLKSHLKYYHQKLIYIWSSIPKLQSLMKLNLTV